MPTFIPSFATTQTIYFAWIVGEQPERAYSRILQYLGTAPVFSQIRSKTKFQVCFYGIPALLLNHFHRSMQLCAAIAARRTKNIAGNVIDVAIDLKISVNCQDFTG